MNICIIGNGILGLASALEISKKISKTDKLYIIGPQNRNYSATMAAGAMLNSYAEITKDYLTNKYNRTLFEFSRKSTKMWPKFLEEIQSNLDYDNSVSIKNKSGYNTGSYIINNTAADSLDDENFKSIRSTLIKYKEPYEDIDPKLIPNYLPEEKNRALKSLFIRNEGWLNPRILLDAIQLVLNKCKNVKFLDCTAKVLHAKKRVNYVTTDNNLKIYADKFLLATGASVSGLIKNSRINLNIPNIFYGIGNSIELITPYINKNVIRTPNRGGACGVYAVPYGSNNKKLIIGASNLISIKPFKYGRLISISHLLKSAAVEINLNLSNALIKNINTGFRPVSEDLYPLIGRSSTINNLFFLTGTNRDGFHLSPYLSKQISKMILCEETDHKIKLFKPERKLIRTLSRKNAVNRIIQGLMSEYYQHEFNPPRIPTMLLDYEKCLRDEVERVHDRTGAKDWGINPLLYKLYKNNRIK